MNSQIFQGNWEQVKGQMKQTWGWLTDNDLMQIEGNQEEIYGKIQARTGCSEEEARREVEAFNSRSSWH